jgi:hypothetical protein
VALFLFLERTKEMPIVEHNDVDLKPLFAWSKEFKITSATEEPITVYMRVLGDADMGRARVSALRRSAELRKKLRDENSDERYAFIKDIDDLSVELLVSLVIVFSMKEIAEIANSKVKIKLPKSPKSDAKTEEHEKYQADVDSYPVRRKEELRKLMDKEILARKEALEQEPKENLYKKYLVSIIDELCEQELLTAFKEWCCYLGSYKDAELTIRFFDDFNEFANLPSNLKAQFMETYSALELYGEDLKKLRQVTP